MNTALLHGNTEIHLDQMRNQFLENPELERTFRAFSAKRDFTCICCGSAVSMNLPENYSFYFRHINSQECAYSKNDKVYNRDVSAYQDVRKKDLGLTLFKEILEGMVRISGASLLRGYRYRKELTFVPDFLIEFDSGEIWAVDYITNAVRDISNGRYAAHMEARKKYYTTQKFRSFFFIDDSWYTALRETGTGTLTPAEAIVSYRVSENDQWDAWLQSLPPAYKHLLDRKYDLSLNLKNVLSESINYVDIEKRICRLLRYIPHIPRVNNQHYYQLFQHIFPLEEALTLNKDVGFSSVQEYEDQAREDLQKLFDEELIAIQRNEHAREERQKREKEFAEKQRKNHSQAGTYRSKPWDYKFNEKTQYSEDHSDEEIDRIMERRILEAAKRPVDVGTFQPSSWAGFQRAGYSKPHIKAADPITIKELKTTWEKKKIEKVYERWIEYPVFGSAYIHNPAKEWKDEVLSWIEEQPFQPAITIRMDELLTHLESQGILFLQNQSLSKAPIKVFLEYYQKELKKEFKFTLAIEFISH